MTTNDVRPVPQVELRPTRSMRRPTGVVKHVYEFANGYSASVIQGPGTYGYERGRWELAVIGPDGSLAYDTPVTNDVLDNLTDAAVGRTLAEIAALAPVPPAANGGLAL